MRDHRPIIGDLIEEYREVVLPARGMARAALWFVGQLLSLVRPWMWGLLLGIALGAMNLISTVIAPLAEDEPPAVLALAVAVLGAWTVIGFVAGRRRFDITDSVKAGALAAVITTGIFSAANLTRTDRRAAVQRTDRRRVWRDWGRDRRPTARCAGAAGCSVTASLALQSSRACSQRPGTVLAYRQGHAPLPPAPTRQRLRCQAGAATPIGS